jgi:hypothetical protein
MIRRQRWCARFIHRNRYRNHLPRTWTHPYWGRMAGAQILPVPRALKMVERRYDPYDDWFRRGRDYDALALMRVYMFSGDEGPRGYYRAIVPGDIREMYVISLRSVDRFLRTHPPTMDMLGELIDRARRVYPEWVHHDRRWKR